MRIGNSVELVNVLVVIGVTEQGHKQVIALQAGDKESAANWRELFKDLKKRGLDSNKIQLGIMDGLPGLEYRDTMRSPMTPRDSQCQPQTRADRPYIRRIARLAASMMGSWSDARGCATALQPVPYTTNFSILSFHVMGHMPR